MSKKTATKPQDQDQARTTLKSARKALANYKGDADTPKYRELNDKVNEAEQALPWHRR